MKFVFSLQIGTCNDLVNNYTCNCHVGFTGSHCDIEIKNCTIDSCYPNVTCFKNSETISCGPCPTGLSGDGKNCEGDYKKYFHLRSTVKCERFFAQVYFTNETVSQTTVSTGPMKMFRLEHETMNVCQRNVARFVHV